MQLITVTGNLGQDAELKTLPNGTSVYELSIACNDKVKQEETVTWYRVSMFGDFWKGVAPHLVRSTKVMVSGKYSFRTFTKKDGGSGYSHEIKCNELELIGGKPSSSDTERPRAEPQGATKNPFLDT